MALPIAKIRHQFPIFQRLIAGHPLAYLDSAATSQKPECVLATMSTYYRTQNANAHRGMHPLAEEATDAYEHARRVVQNFIHARCPEEIVFTKSCTEAINLVAHSLSPRGEPACRQAGVRVRGRHVVLSLLEHHSNIIPWMQRGARLHWIDIDAYGVLQHENLCHILKNNTVDLVAITGQSNVLGIRPPLEELIERSHAAGALVLVDAAQLVAHYPIDVRKLDCDFLTFSGHKLYGPTGIGMLYGKRELLEQMPPMLGGGGMVQTVDEASFTPLEPPARFEAGTPPIAEAVGLATAIDWLSQFSWEDIISHEQQLLAHARGLLSNIDGLIILGSGNKQVCHPERSRGTTNTQCAWFDYAHHDTSGCLSFIINSLHPHDLTEILGREGICLRAGHHCAQPLHRRLGITASTRLSVGLYNTLEEIERLPDAITRAQKLLRGIPKSYFLSPIS